MFQDFQNVHHKLNPVEQLAKPREKVLQRFPVDTRYIGDHAPESLDGGIEKNERCGGLVMN